MLTGAVVEPIVAVRSPEPASQSQLVAVLELLQGSRILERSPHLAACQELRL